MNNKLEISAIIKRRTSALTFILGATSFAFAQQKINVSGKVISQTQNGIPYASIIFNSKDNKAFNDAVLSDDKGNFSVDLVRGNYEIIVEAIDFKKSILNKQISGGNIGNLILQAEAVAINGKTKDIQGLTITAQAKAYKVELDKKTYDPSQDMLSKGGNLQDVLTNVPSVSVDTDGTVSMRGNTNVKFLINGKPSALLGIDDGANALRSIPADQIERIEVITNPSSKFEASGTAGILNIILKKNKKTGFNGSVIGSLGYFPQTSLNTNLNWRKGSFTWFLNGGGGYREMRNTRNVDSWYKNSTLKELTEAHQQGKNENKTDSYNATIGAIYDISPKTSINASGTIRTFSGDSFDENTYLNLRNSFADEHKSRNSVGKNSNLALQGDFGIDQKIDDKGQNISASISIQSNKSKNNTDYTQISDINYLALGRNFGNFNLIDRDRTYSQNNTIIAKIDYELPIGENSKLEAGYRLDSNKNYYDNFGDSSTGNSLSAPNFIVNQDFTSKTHYKELFNAVYAQFKSKAGNFGYQLGLRDEISKVDVDFTSLSKTTNPISKNYNNLFPSLFLSYDLGKNNQLLFNYSRRIDRPRALFLIPYSSRNDNQNKFSGNPNLNPSYINSYELGYNFSKKKISVNPTLYFRDEKDNVNVIRILNPTTKTFSIMPINIGKQKRFGLDINTTYDPFRWWKIMGSVDLFSYKNMDAYYNEDNNFNGSGFSSRIRLTNTFKIDKTFSMQLQGFYKGGEKTKTQHTKAMYAISFGASKNIWNGDGTISFNIQDIFNTRSRTIYQNTESYNSYIYMQWMPRQFALSLTYRFKQGENIEQTKHKKDVNFNEQNDEQSPPM